MKEFGPPEGSLAPPPWIRQWIGIFYALLKVYVYAIRNAVGIDSHCCCFHPGFCCFHLRQTSEMIKVVEYDARVHEMIVINATWSKTKLPCRNINDSDKCDIIKSFRFWFYNGGLWGNFFKNIFKYLREIKKYVSKLILQKLILQKNILK